MLWHCFYFALLLLSCCLFYGSHKNQLWFKQPLPQTPWRLVGLLFQIIALTGELMFYSASSAIFGWLALNMLILSVLPFINLFWGQSKNAK
ncbi:hypothetical protein N7931_06190 [Catenovulum sp. 2E275]|uniref:hypothetical protein n=1 Tax=Catenovulum sp. 2E275 TaxID=2980497 RepID=UPI0021D2A766|nr:hypothetical protein [Catenovulum sp. 2E275]MCU4675219.1 hypothetical protein [Catenovulum sp. 2E275]